MPEKKVKWTDQQLRAIAGRGSDVLVTASAGTGKTAVLSGRCVDIVSDKSVYTSILNTLVLTFTDAAADQMRSRIGNQLREAFSEYKDPHLRHQLVLLPGADISTIHSFCKRIITENFYKLGLDPTFRIIDSDERKLLKAEILDKTVNWAWQQSNLTEAIGQLLRRRDLRTGDGFLAGIINLSDFLDGVTSRQNWYERASVLAEAINPLTSRLGEKQKEIIKNKLRHIIEQLRHCQRLCGIEGPKSDWTARCEENFIRPITKCIKLVEAGDWDKCAEQIRNFQKPSRFGYKPKGFVGAVAEVIGNTSKVAVEAFGELRDLAVLNPDYLDKVSGAVGLQTKMVIELVKKFDQLYSQAKRAINCLDFADLEHYALELLADEDFSEDKLLPSEAALALRRRYKYIFVDEYQDINPVQQAILDLLSSGGNVFVVGDVKQSIYAFRSATSDAFFNRLRTASAEPDSAADGLRVELNINWRSNRGILDFVNGIFSRIMTASFAKIDYDESAQLRLASECKDKKTAGEAEPVVELHILEERGSRVNKSAEEDIAAISSRQCQAVVIARRIKEMVGAETGRSEFQIYDKDFGGLRDVGYRDIVILMRSPSKRVDDYVEVLREAGVPVSCSGSSGYFEKTEISDLLCLLKVLDNPHRDIELAGVLRSPFFNVSDTELAKIKLCNKTERGGGSFYDSVLQCCDLGQDAELGKRLEEILAVIEQWRKLALSGNLADLIWQIYCQSGFLSFVLALPGGRQRRANLLKLHDRAIQFESFASSSGNVSLGRFVEFIEKLQEAGQDWASAEPEAETENAVRIMSVHKSKGLEFPVVFLAELNSQFSKKDLQGDLLAGTDDTLGLQIIDCRSNSRLSSLAHQIIAEQKLSTSLAEEMRILYVATTRAKERLILNASASKSNCRRIVSNGFFFGDEPVAHWQLRSCKSGLEWILYGLSNQRNLHIAFETGLVAETVGGDLFSLKLYSQIEIEQLCRYVDGLRKNKSCGSKSTVTGSKPKRMKAGLYSQVKENLAWQYSFGDAPALRAKDSVTQLTHYSDEYFRADCSSALYKKPKAVLSDLTGSVDGRAIGAAVHCVISELDLARPVTREAVEEIRRKLLVEGTIRDRAAKYIYTELITAFFESELGQAALDADNIVYREWPFTFGLPVSVADVSSCEIVVVQGIIDMLIRTPKGLLIIDFKTDNITAEQVPERAELYRRQLELYGRAAEAILKTEASDKWLYFLKPGCKFKIE